MLRRGCGNNFGWRGLLAAFFILWTSYGFGAASSSARECGIWVALSRLPWVDENLLTLAQPYQDRVLQYAEEQAKAALGFRTGLTSSSLPRWDQVGETAENYLAARSYSQSLSPLTRSQLARTMERGKPFEADLVPHLANQFLHRITKRADTDGQSPFYTNALMPAAIVVYLVGDLDAQERVLAEVTKPEMAGFPLLLVVNETAPLLLQGDQRKQLLHRTSAIRYSPRGMNLIGSEITVNTATIHLFAAEAERGQIASLIAQINRAALRNSLRQRVSYVIDSAVLRVAADWNFNGILPRPLVSRGGMVSEGGQEIIADRSKVQPLAFYLTEESPSAYNADYGFQRPINRFGLPIRFAVYFTRIENSANIFLLFR